MSCRKGRSTLARWLNSQGHSLVPKTKYTTIDCIWNVQALVNLQPESQNYRHQNYPGVRKQRSKHSHSHTVESSLRVLRASMQHAPSSLLSNKEILQVDLSEARGDLTHSDRYDLTSCSYVDDHLIPAFLLDRFSCDSGAKVR